MEKEKLYQPGEIAELVGVSSHTIRRWTKEGFLTATKNERGWRFYDDEQLVKAIKIVREKYIRIMGRRMV